MRKEILTVKQIAHEEKVVWIEQAIQEGGLSKRPFQTSQTAWEKQQDIGITYTFGDVTFGDLANIHGRTREDIRRLNHKFLNNIHKNSSPQLQTQYPRETIPDRKPLGQKSRERASEAQGGSSLIVKELIERGITDPKQIKDILAISADGLTSIRKTLRRWDIDVPRIFKSFQEILEKIKEEDDKKLQEFLDSLSPGSLRGFLEKDSERETLTTISTIARKKGFHPHSKDIRLIAEKVKAAGIPLTITREAYKDGKVLHSYHIVCTKHTERVAKVLNSDPDLQRLKKNPVTLAFGESSFLPNTTRLKDKKKYKGGLTKLISEITGISLKRRDVMMDLSSLLTSSPVPIFTSRIRNSKTNSSHPAYYFQRDKEQELRNFTAQKWKEMQKKAKQG